MSERYSVKVLQDCIDLQNRKGKDYQNEASSVRQADYYPHGIMTIYDIMHAKMLRIKSVMDTLHNDGSKPNFESLQDSAKDLINYASFFVAYCEGQVDGQKPGHDVFNKKIKTPSESLIEQAVAITSEAAENALEDAIKNGSIFSVDGNTYRFGGISALSGRYLVDSSKIYPALVKLMNNKKQIIFSDIAEDYAAAKDVLSNISNGGETLFKSYLLYKNFCWIFHNDSVYQIEESLYDLIYKELRSEYNRKLQDALKSK